MTQLDQRIRLRQSYLAPEAFHTREQTDELYAVPHVNFPEWVLSRHTQRRGDERVLDIGAAYGVYYQLAPRFFPNGAYYPAEWSTNLLSSFHQQPATPGCCGLVGSPAKLPFAADTFDVVLANDMLYHLPDVAAAINEVHRVLKPTGVLIAATHSRFTMAEFDTLTRRTLTLLGHPPADNTSHFGLFLQNFDLEVGSILLARKFRAVMRHDMPGTLVFKEAKPVIDFLNSSRAAREPYLPEAVQWEDFIAVMADQVRRLISHFGELTINRLSGVLLAADSGSFAKDYFDILDGR
ncbi:MAG: class I SAM-dependent methyltransferase [Chloroflexi bacterium]|nr:class I SAM-dependent methyltransferase [Chloroflexota bacterium]